MHGLSLLFFACALGYKDCESLEEGIIISGLRGMMTDKPENTDGELFILRHVFFLLRKIIIE
jgi:hypothetical protein